jgi:hypothetical protein
MEMDATLPGASLRSCCVRHTTEPRSLRFLSFRRRRRRRNLRHHGCEKRRNDDIQGRFRLALGFGMTKSGRRIPTERVVTTRSSHRYPEDRLLVQKTAPHTICRYAEEIGIVNTVTLLVSVSRQGERRCGCSLPAEKRNSQAGYLNSDCNPVFLLL